MKWIMIWIICIFRSTKKWLLIQIIQIEENKYPNQVTHSWRNGSWIQYQLTRYICDDAATDHKIAQYAEEQHKDRNTANEFNSVKATVHDGPVFINLHPLLKKSGKPEVIMILSCSLNSENLFMWRTYNAYLLGLQFSLSLATHELTTNCADRPWFCVAVFRLYFTVTLSLRRQTGNHVIHYVM